MAIVNCRLSAFGEKNNVVIYVVETTVTMPKPSVDHVVGAILPPSLWMMTYHNIFLLPAHIPCLFVKEPWPFQIACILYRGKGWGRFHEKPNVKFLSPVKFDTWIWVTSLHKALAPRRPCMVAFHSDLVTRWVTAFAGTWQFFHMQQYPRHKLLRSSYLLMEITYNKLQRFLLH